MNMNFFLRQEMFHGLLFWFTFTFGSIYAALHWPFLKLQGILVHPSEMFTIFALPIKPNNLNSILLLSL